MRIRRKHFPEGFAPLLHMMVRTNIVQREPVDVVDRATAPESGFRGLVTGSRASNTRKRALRRYALQNSKFFDASPVLALGSR
jgi:hypothetical protein